MSERLQPRQEPQPLTNEELLHQAEKYAKWAMNNYGTRNEGNEYAQTAAGISQALGTLVIARILNGQDKEPRPEMPIIPNTPTGEIKLEEQ